MIRRCRQISSCERRAYFSSQNTKRYKEDIRLKQNLLSKNERPDFRNAGNALKVIDERMGENRRTEVAIIILTFSKKSR